jgi:predicted nucleic acid-binding protein
VLAREALQRDVALVAEGEADEIIAATSLVHRVPLVTRDRRLEA